jgi:hypothetical protein
MVKKPPDDQFSSHSLSESQEQLITQIAAKALCDHYAGHFLAGVGVPKKWLPNELGYVSQ